MPDLKKRVEIKITLGLAILFIFLALGTWFTHSYIFLNTIGVIVACVLILAPLGCVFIPESFRPGSIAAGIAVLSILTDFYLYWYRIQVVRLSFEPSFNIADEESRKLFESHIPRAGVMILYGPKAQSDKAAINGLDSIKAFVKNSADSQERVNELEAKVQSTKGTNSGGYARYVNGHVSYVSQMPGKDDGITVIALETAKKTTTTTPNTPTNPTTPSS